MVRQLVPPRWVLIREILEFYTARKFNFHFESDLGGVPASSRQPDSDHLHRSVARFCVCFYRAPGVVTLPTERVVWD